MSRFLDSRGRIFGKVNIVDLIVLCVIVAIAAFAVVRMTGDSSTPISVTVTYTVEEVRQATVDALLTAVQAKATVRDDGGVILGTLIDISAAPTKEEYPTDAGGIVAVDSLIYSDVTIRVRGQAQVSNSTYRIGGVSMGVGKKVNLRGPGFEVQTVIHRVKPD
jgi:hypothetical protein